MLRVTVATARDQVEDRPDGLQALITPQISWTTLMTRQVPAVA
jgi:hypothetical protein